MAISNTEAIYVAQKCDKFYRMLGERRLPARSLLNKILSSYHTEATKDYIVDLRQINADWQDIKFHVFYAGSGV